MVSFKVQKKEIITHTQKFPEKRGFFSNYLFAHFRSYEVYVGSASAVVIYGEKESILDGFYGILVGGHTFG